MTVPCNCSDTELCETGQRLTDARDTAIIRYEDSLKQGGEINKRLHDEYWRCTKLLEAHLERAPYFSDKGKTTTG
ncbi:hypothetical protein ACFL6E_05040 [Candidatus Neomarinimicrobiota bacterium]